MDALLLWGKAVYFHRVAEGEAVPFNWENLMTVILCPALFGGL